VVLWGNNLVRSALTSVTPITHRKAPFEGEVQPLGEGAWSVSPGEGWATPGDQLQAPTISHENTISRAAARSRTFPLSPRGRLWLYWRGSQLWGRLWCRSSSRNLFALSLRSFVYRTPSRLCWLWGPSIFDCHRRRHFWHRRLFVLSKHLNPDVKIKKSRTIEPGVPNPQCTRRQHRAWTLHSSVQQSH